MERQKRVLNDHLHKALGSCYSPIVNENGLIGAKWVHCDTVQVCAECKGTIKAGNETLSACKINKNTKKMERNYYCNFCGQRLVEKVLIESDRFINNSDDIFEDMRKIKIGS